MKSTVTLITFLSLIVFSVSGISQTLCPEKLNSDRPVHSDSYVNIGGIKQWVTIHGEHCNNPIILFLHGGPGQSDTPITRSQYGYWEENFVVVQWDQRGTALTYSANPVPEKLSLKEMIGDGIGLSEYLTAQLAQDKIIVTGHSWGAALGMQMIHQRPDLFYAYVGRSVPVSLVKNLNASLKNLITVVKENNDQESYQLLQSIKGEWRTLDEVMALGEVIEKYAVPLSGADTKYELEAIYNNKAYFQNFGKADAFSRAQGFNADSGGLAIKVDLYKLGFEYDVPVFFIQAEKDLMTMPVTTKAYFNLIKAPLKKYVLVPNRGHNSAFIEDNYKVMMEDVLPIVSAGAKN